MQILIFTLLFLATLSTMSYQSYQSYLERAQLRKSLWSYLENGHRVALYQKEKNNYNNFQSKSTPDPEEKEEKTSKLTPHNTATHFDLRFFIQAEEEQKSYLEQFISRLLQRLLHDRPVIKKIAEEHPDWSLILTQHLHRMLMDRTISNLIDLATIEFEEPWIKDAFYYLLKGSDPSQNRNGIFNIKDYLVVNTKPRPLIVYRAPSDLLYALFDNDAFVDELLKKRKEIRIDLKNKAEEKEDLQKEFNQFVLSNSPQWLIPNITTQISRGTPIIPD